MCHNQLPALQAELVQHRLHQPIELVLGPRQQAAVIRGPLRVGWGVASLCILCVLPQMLNSRNTVLLENSRTLNRTC